MRAEGLCGLSPAGAARRRLRAASYVRRERTTKTAVIAAAIETWLDEHETVPEFPFVGIGRSNHGRLSLDGRSIARREAGRRPGDP